VELRVGKKEPQAVDSADLLLFSWRPPTVRAEYFAMHMEAPDGPYGTRDYRLHAEAIPIDAGRTFVHLGYSFGYGGAGNFAMSLYLNTVARGKVGFTREAVKGKDDGYIGGMRGIAERNTMRYFLAIEVYLDSLRLPADHQWEHRVSAWFDATERYARQLRELDKESYTSMKRSEVQRQLAAR
jgi:hypothetical protein